MDKLHLRGSFRVARWVVIELCVIAAASVSSLSLAATTPASSSPNTDLDLARHLEGAFERVADQTSPSVVVITTKHKEVSTSDSSGGDDGENEHQFKGTPFEFFFHHMPQELPDVESQGSGVILRKDGYILTNQHVIDGGGQITVLLKDGTKFTNALVVGVDDRIDVAVIKVDGKNLPAARLGDSDAVKVGQWAIAIGAPYELDYSFTVGVVSAKNRSGVAGRGNNAYEDYLQTDASINPGNSGGPLCDIEGRVIGINTLIRGLNPGHPGFAIPINMAMDSADKLIKEGKVKRPWIGIGIEGVDDDKDFAAFQDDVKDGIVVREIREGTPAAKSDLQPADVIVAVDDVPVENPRELQQQILRKNIGQKVVLSVVRGGEKVHVTIQTDEMPDQLQMVSLERHVIPKSENAFGLTVQTLTQELAERLKIAASDGVVVTDVADGSAAQQRGLQHGDVITSVNRAPAHSVEDFKSAIAKANPEKGVLLFVHRGRATTFVLLKDSK
jgi:Do/DeqQ family serine protease